MQNSVNLQTIGLSLEIFHVQSNTSFELLPHLNIIRIGKPKNKLLGDINLSNLPNAKFVSRLHAEIQVEKNIYYLVDVGSSNGTFLNNVRLKPKQRYRLKLGDKIDLGNVSVTFLFQKKHIAVPEPITLLNNPATVIQILFGETNRKPTLKGRFRSFVRIIEDIWYHTRQRTRRFASTLKKFLRKLRS